MGSSPVISTPSAGHEHLPEAGRIHSASQRLMTSSRMHLPGPTRCCRQISIRLLPAQHVEGGFGQVPRHGSHGVGVSLALTQPEVELTDMPLGAALVVHRHGVPRFGKRPL